MSELSGNMTIPDQFRRQFAAVWGHEIAQMNRRFENAGMLAPDWTAKEYVYNDLNELEAVETTGQRFGDTNVQELSTGSRKGYARQLEAGVIKDVWDDKWLMQQAVPDSELVTKLRNAINRKLDDFFIEATSADVLGGVEPHNTVIPLPNTSKIAVNAGLGGVLGANTPLTPYKILHAKTRLGSAEVDLQAEDLCIGLNWRQIEMLASWVASAPNDTWAKIVGAWLEQHEQGKVTKLMGLNVIMTERLKLAAGVRTVPVFAKSAFKLSPLTSKHEIDKLAMKRHALQVANYSTQGVLRIHDKKVQLISCEEI